MILEVVKYGHPTLRQKGARIESITPSIQRLIDDMFETMYANKGVGLAAQMPEQPLLGDALGHPAYGASLHARQPALVVQPLRLTGAPKAALALGFGKHLAELRAQPAKDAARPGNQAPKDAGLVILCRVSRHVSDLGRGLVRHLTIELVTVGADGHQIDIHY